MCFGAHMSACRASVVPGVDGQTGGPTNDCYTHVYYTSQFRVAPYTGRVACRPLYEPSRVPPDRPTSRAISLLHQVVPAWACVISCQTVLKPGLVPCSSRASCHPLSTSYFPVLSSQPMKWSLAAPCWHWSSDQIPGFFLFFVIFQK
jgi:hypothetical protein